MSTHANPPALAATPIGHLLVIDDDPQTFAIGEAALSAAGIRTTWTGDGISGLEAAASSTPDLIVLDLYDAKLDGFEVCRRLRRIAGLQLVPIIFLTPLDGPDAVRRALDCGASDFIRKPLIAPLLVHRLREALRAQRALDDLDHQQHELDRQRQGLEQAQRLARIGTWQWIVEGHRFECTPAYRELMGLPCDIDVQAFERLIEQLLEPVHPQDRSRVQAALSATWQNGAPYRMSYRIVKVGGGQLVVNEKVDAVTDARGQVVRVEGTVQDVSERVADRERIRELSQQDLLTGLTNRNRFSQAISPLLSDSILRGNLASVLDINLDRFTRINETLGHAAGDQVLQEVATRIRRSVRLADHRASARNSLGQDLYARTSGDEFAVLLTGLQRPQDAELVARRILSEIARPIELSGQTISVTACIGIALSNRIGIDSGTLLRDAEAALRQAKQNKAGSIAVFAPDADGPKRSSLSLEGELRVALAEGQFLLHYQPRVDVHTGHIVGAEALIRWLHPQRGLVMPGHFIAVAEESGQIEAITEWVLEGVCRQQALWRDSGLALVPVSVNYSSCSFQGDGPAQSIQEALSRHRLPASAIEVEITESVMMQNIDAAARTLAELRAMGLELAIDDFGTGFSSLNYLKRLPVSVLKIDRDFVKDVLVNAHDGAIATAIVALSQAIGLRVVAEGVETIEQARFLLALGCRLMQGYLFSRPIGAAEFERALRQGLSLPAALGAEPAARTPELSAMTG